MRWRWVHNRWFAVIAGTIVGGAVGFAIYQGSRLTGEALFVLCGITAGLVAAIVINGYARTIHLTEVTVSVPQFSELKFVVTRNNELVAWRLFVEATTRVAVQPLADGHGIIREALSSFYALFTTVRQLLVEAHPSTRTSGKPTIEHLAIAMLNNEMRPFLSEWHARLSDWERANPGRSEAEWPEKQQCRTELEALRLRMLIYVAGFGELAGVPNVEQMMRGSFDGTPPDPPFRQATRARVFVPPHPPA